MPAHQPGESAGGLTAQQLSAKLRELIDTRPTGTPIPLEWAVSAYFLGDMNGLASLRLRSHD